MRSDRLSTPGQRWAWAFYDFANSGYATVVLTTIYATWFVAVIAPEAQATLIWTLAVASANGIVLVLAPVLGAWADHSACKRCVLQLVTVLCVISTALLGFFDAAFWLIATLVFVVSLIAFSLAEQFISAFLPELAVPEETGRLSAWGWGLGYVGGILSLLGALAFMHFAADLSMAMQIRLILLWTAALFAIASLPALIMLRDRNRPSAEKHNWRAGWQRLQQTLRDLRGHRDLFVFLTSLLFYNSGVYAVIVLAAIYAQAVFGMTTEDTIMLILVVNFAAIIGALGFGWIQDRIGSVPTLQWILLLWLLAMLVAGLAETRAVFWIAAQGVGLALGASQSAGRALVALFTPQGREAETMGLWSFAVRLSAIMGPLFYGIIETLNADHRHALLGLGLLFVIGFVVLLFVNEARGRAAAGHA